jgi:putative ABC transport system ATP-binding protein
MPEVEPPGLAAPVARPPLRVRLEGIVRVYSGPEGEVRALDGVNLQVVSGELVCLTGPSGSGKSTLLHILGLLDTPTSGSYRLDGEDVARLDDAAAARRRNRDIGFVFQTFHLIPHLTVAENVELPLAYRGVAPAERAERARRALERVDLAHRARHLPGELSGGEQQRASIARALVGEPRLLLADEPTGNLDEATSGPVLETFREIRARGTAVVLVTHNPRVAAIGDRVHELRAGRLR